MLAAAAQPSNLLSSHALAFFSHALALFFHALARAPYATVEKSGSAGRGLLVCVP